MRVLLESRLGQIVTRVRQIPESVPLQGRVPSIFDAAEPDLSISIQFRLDSVIESGSNRKYLESAVSS